MTVDRFFTFKAAIVGILAVAAFVSPMGLAHGQGAGGDKPDDREERALNEGANETFTVTINGTDLAIPGAFIWNRGLRRDGDVASINLFLVMPDMTPLDTEAPAGESTGFGPALLANLTTLQFEVGPDELFAAGVDDGYWRADEIDRDREGLYRLSGPISERDVTRWYAIVADRAVDVLISCMVEEDIPYPSCTAHGAIWDLLALRVNFDATRLAGFEVWWPRFLERLDDFRAEGEAVDL